VSGYPVLLDGRAITALVVGGGAVALRKVRALLAAGARVRVIAPAVEDEITALLEREPSLTIEQRAFDDGDIGDANLVIAATDDRSINARVGRLARERHRLVNVVDAATDGNFVSMATHRAGDVVIAVSAGGVPRAAARIRDAIAERFDDRYASAIAAIQTARRRLLDSGGADAWERTAGRMLDDDFCARVESGVVPAEVDAWR